jgi:outer membrane protein OmpA-like peptidoglycan-associated protein
MARYPLLASLLLSFIATTASAQDVRQYRAGDAVDPREVAAILGQLPVAAPAMKMRSIRLLDDGQQPQQLAASSLPDSVASEIARPAPRAASLSLPVQFGFDSADILPTARQQLDALAEGIRLLPEAKTVLVQGHTDAAGSDQYNEQLSQRRAQAVKRYLVVAQGIDPSRLRAVGMGEYQPLHGSDAYAAENRRVQFRGE